MIDYKEFEKRMDDYFNGLSDEEMKEFVDDFNSIDDDSPTVEEYLAMYGDTAEIEGNTDK